VEVLRSYPEDRSALVPPDRRPTARDSFGSPPKYIRCRGAAARRASLDPTVAVAAAAVDDDDTARCRYCNRYPERIVANACIGAR